MKHRTRIKTGRWLALLLCLCISVPSFMAVVSAEEEPVYTDELCEHHPKHTEECKEAAAPCAECAAANGGGETQLSKPDGKLKAAKTDDRGTDLQADDRGTDLQADEKGEITSLTLKDFTGHGETAVSDVDLLEKTETDQAVQWDVFNSYTLEIGVALPAGADDNTLVLTLPLGMKFVGLDASHLEETDGIASATYQRDEKIGTVFSPESGTLTVVFDSSVEKLTFSIGIQPDVALFPVEKRSEGFLIPNAVQAALKNRNDELDKEIIPVHVQINEEANQNAPSFETLGIGDIADKTPDVAPGEIYNLTGSAWTGWFTYNGVQNYRVRSKVVVVLSVPKELTLETRGTAWVIEDEKQEDPGNTGHQLWTLTAGPIYAPGPTFTNQISVKIPEDAQVNTKYEIRQHSMSVTTYGQDTAWTVGEPEKPLWTFTVQNPEEEKVSITGKDAPNVYDYTQKLAVNDQPFTDYQTAFAGSIIRNDGVGEITGKLIYKAEFDQDVQFVTAVGIPCGWDDADNTWLPTKMTVRTDKGKTYTISADGDDYSAIRKLADASIKFDDYGFILRAADIPGFDAAESIRSVEVELPGLPKGYKSSLNPLNERVGSGNCYSGAWGRVRENRGETSMGTNSFTLYKESDPANPIAVQTSTTTIVDSGRISADLLASTVKTSVAGGEAIHIRQNISPSVSYAGFHNAEPLLYDPVVYLLEPGDMSIEHEMFTVVTTGKDGSSSSEEISYNKKEITTVENLPDGYKLYEYRLSEKVMLGWWSGEWESTAMRVDFDYRTSSAANTKVYNLKDLIFYKSALGFEMINNSVSDTYGLNNGKGIGGIIPTSFTVQAVSGFNIAAAIQIEGEEKWYSYNPDDAANTTSVFTEGAAANVKITVINNSGAAADSVEVYVPVPKKKDDFWGEYFVKQNGFDMFAAGVSGTVPPGWTVQYGKAVGIKENENGVPTDISLEGDWSGSYDRDTNVIKLVLTGTLENSGQEEIVLKFKATEDAGQTDSMNIFKSWFKYTTRNTSMVDTGKNYNFGTLLQNGKLSGAVYLDANRNGKMDAGETGVPDVVVKVTDSDGRSYERKTDADGKYAFRSLHGSKEMNVTVINPKSPAPNTEGGSYRFSPTVATTGQTTGSDVTSADDHRTASKSGIKLSDSGGTASVNAGLIEPYTVTFTAASGRGSVSPSSVRAYSGQKLSEVLKQPPSVTSEEGWEFAKKWTDGTDIVLQEELLSEEVSKDVTYTAKFTSEEKITVTPANIVIYMGGKPYEGAVDENGNLISDENAGLPEPGFTVQLPETLDGTEVTKLTFQEKDGERTWTFEPYDGQENTRIYRLVPVKGQEATRVQFTDPDNGNVIPSDQFIVGLEVNKTFEMEMYKGSGDSKVGEIVVEAEGAEYPVDSSTKGSLTVRGTTEEVYVVPVRDTEPENGPGAVAQAGTTYTINDSDVQVTDRSGVSLLFDEIINNGEDDRSSQLKARAEVYLQTQDESPADLDRLVYEFKYLDLVDANNGNAWVKASQDVTIYWPLPENVDADTLKVLHFQDLHRDMQTGQIESEISNCEVEELTPEIQGDYVTFKVGAGGFSPFALIWEEKAADDPGNENSGDGNEGDRNEGDKTNQEDGTIETGKQTGTSENGKEEAVKTGDPAPLALCIALLVLSGTGMAICVYRKKRGH